MNFELAHAGYFLNLSLIQQKKLYMLRKFASLLAILFSTLGSTGQQVLPSYLGSKTLYQCQQEHYTPPPQGYAPVFINHVGRHGARHLTKDVASSLAFTLLQKADSAGALTPNGKRLKEMVTKLERVEKSDVESISYEGGTEQELIAERAYKNYLPVFDQPHPKFSVTVTKKKRTSQTADAFLSGLSKLMTLPHIEKKVNDTTLRFYDLSPVYVQFDEEGNWTTAIEELKKAHHYESLTTRFTQQFFTPDFFKKLKNKDCAKFTDNIFGFESILFSIRKEIADHGYSASDISFSEFFDCNDLETLGRIDDAEDFLVKGPGQNNMGIQVKIAVPLLADFINSTDTYIRSKPIDVQLRFTHAEAIAPYAALLGVSGASESTDIIGNYSKYWDAARVIPLSSNIQWVLYKKKGKKKYLVKVLLNEKEVAITGLSTDTFPYYNWKDLRSFYKKRIAQLGSSLNENGYQYLLRTK